MKTEQVLVKAGETVRGIVYFEDTILNVSPEYAEYLRGRGALAECECGQSGCRECYPRSL
jgi:hypothetical protein